MNTMNALISGQAGVAVLLDVGPTGSIGETAPTEQETLFSGPKPLYALALNPPGARLPCKSWADVQNLFAGADDVTEYHDITHEKVVDLLGTAWARDRALQLVLALLDAKLKTETRVSAAKSIVKLFSHVGEGETGDVKAFVANRLHSVPLPNEGVDLSGAIRVAEECEKTSDLITFLLQLDEAQQGIMNARRVWDKLPLDLFGREVALNLEKNEQCEREKKRIELALISMGIFRELARMSEMPPTDDLRIALHDLECYYTPRATAANLPSKVIAEFVQQIGHFSAYREAERKIEVARHSGATTLYLPQQPTGLSLVELPETLIELTQLEVLNLSGHSLSELPEWLGRLTRLRELNLSRNTLTELPETIGRLTGLQVLNLRDNSLSNLPEGFRHLTELRKLDLAGNRLMRLPISLGYLANLQTLNLYGNVLTELPTWIGHLTQLRDLTLWNNNLKILPESLTHLPHLQRLDLEANQLEDLPPTMGQLAQLQTLYVGSNHLKDLPISLTELTQLRTLQLAGNPLNPELEVAVQHGVSAVLSYLSVKADE